MLSVLEHVGTLVPSNNELEIEIELIVKQLSVLHYVCELAINLAFAQAPKQFDANRPSVVILLDKQNFCIKLMHFALQNGQAHTKL